MIGLRFHCSGVVGLLNTLAGVRARMPLAARSDSDWINFKFNDMSAE